MESLIFTADFECANGVLVDQPGPAALRVRSRPDAAVNTEAYSDADYYCAFRIRNPNPVAVDAHIVVEVKSLPPEGRSLATRYRVPKQTTPVFDWQPIPRETTEIDPVNGTTEFHVYLMPDAELDISTMYWMSATEVYERLDRLGASYPAVHIESIGTTAGGRSIPVAELLPQTESQKKLPALCIAATPQSHELGTIATMYLLSEILDGPLSHLADRARLVFLPLCNPDGNAGGTCMTNDADENLHFGYVETGMRPAECQSIWDYLGSISPTAYVEFHSYPHLSRPSFRPYSWDLGLFPDDRSRESGRCFFSELERISPNTPYRIEADTEQEHRFRTSLPSRLIRGPGVPATIYKLHNRETVTVNCMHAAYVIERLSGVVASMSDRQA